LIGIFMSLLSGILSDHTASRWGKRTPAILIGALIGMPLIGLPALFLSGPWRGVLLPVALPIIIISFCGMQFFTNVGNGAWWPLLVDVVPENQRGLASGLQGGLTLIGAAIGIELVSALNKNGHYTSLALWLVGGIFALSGIANALVIRGKDLPAQSSQRISPWRAMRDMFKVRTRVAVFFWLVLAVFLAYMGLNSLQSFARYFLEVYFPKINVDTAYAIMGGIRLILWAMFLCAAATLGMGLTSNFVLFLVMAAIRSAATGPIFASVPALASDLAPKDEAGQYMAYNNLSTGVSGALAGLIFGVILITMDRSTFMLVFIISAIMFLLGGILFMIKVPQKELDVRITDQPK
jgi:MFS family permease